MTIRTAEQHAERFADEPVQLVDVIREAQREIIMAMAADQCEDCNADEQAEFWPKDEQGCSFWLHNGDECESYAFHVCDPENKIVRAPEFYECENAGEDCVRVEVKGSTCQNCVEPEVDA